MDDGNTWHGNDCDKSSDEDDMLTVITFVPKICRRFLFPPQPRNTSDLQGSDYVAEIMTGKKNHLYRVFGMERRIFLQLAEELIDRKLLVYSRHEKVFAYEALAIFLRIVCKVSRHEDAQDRFQHSNETINRHYTHVLEALVLLATHYIKPPQWDLMPGKIARSTSFYPYFKDCVGAMDGSHFPACVPRDKKPIWRNRKGVITQNVIVACDFDARVTYVSSGWEGSSHDARVLDKCIELDPSFVKPPTGKYYLVDSGYANRPGYLAPYRNSRYHIPEWQACPPKGHIELYNHRHARLRNVIERFFGILKKRFLIFKADMPNFGLEKQAKAVIACCCLHNYIYQFHPENKIFGMSDEDLEINEMPDLDDLQAEEAHEPYEVGINNMKIFRNKITREMWESRN